jgi:subtilisin family serine protease
MNFHTAMLAGENKTELVKVFVRGDASAVRSAVSRYSGKVLYSRSGISVAELPANKINQLASEQAVIRIESSANRNRPLSDTMLIQNNVIPVHSGASPLPQGYDGEGVVIGFIDTGIDFTHPDFLDTAGKSRVQFLWDQTKPLAANTPLPYNYGQEWTATQIDSGLAASHNDVAYGGHGTHVAGLGAGNGLATGNYKGVAPAADIIMVAVDFNSSSPTVIADAADYIYSKAALLGKPCVINASLGDYYGSHDGKDLQAQLISNMIDAQPGRSFVAAVGNGGTTKFHLGYDVTSDTSFTYFSGNSIYIAMYADTADLSNVSFALGTDKLLPSYSERGRLPFSNIDDNLGILSADTLYNGSNRLGIIQSYGDMVNGVYSMEFLISSDSAGYKWKLMTTGSGKFDCWTFDLYDGPLPSSSEMSDSIYYKAPDLEKTTVSSFQCLDNVISVGNYTNRKTYIDYNGNLFVNTSTDPGELHPTSSRGPTRDGRIKPEICAPGDMTLAAVPLSMVPGIVSGYPDALAQGGFHVRNGGSSHASPGVAGIAALYLQRDPNATALQIRSDIICSSRQDTFTGTMLPDNNWGYGKADAFEAMMGCLTTTVHETELGDFLVYPNPSTGTIHFQTGTKASQLRILNNLGQVVYAHEQVTETVALDLPDGIYFCSVVSEKGLSVTKKVVILQAAQH